MTLIDSLNRIIANLRTGRYVNETAVREAVVLPVLADLGWDIYNPDVVRREYRIEERPVDYALCSTAETPIAIIEVKGVGQSTGADRQLFEYAFHVGIPMAILTDGREWSIYLPAEQGRYDERCVYKLDLMERDASEASEKFVRYLEYRRVSNGDAIRDAREDYQRASRDRIATRKIPDAWKSLLDEPDELLIELLSEKVETLCGYAPAREQVVEFLRNKGGAQPLLPGEQGPTGPPNGPSGRNSKHGRRAEGARACGFKLQGRQVQATDATDAVIKVLRTLSGNDDTFLERLSVRIKGKKRNLVAKDRNTIYPGRPDLGEYIREICDGWYLGTNISNREKEIILQKACEVAGIIYGKDLVISL